MPDNAAQRKPDQPELPAASHTDEQAVGPLDEGLLRHLSEWYGENPTGQTLVAVLTACLAPAVGVPLILGDSALKWFGKRGAKQLGLFIEDLRELGFRPTDELLQDEEFQHTLQATVERILRGPRDYKRRLLAQLLAGLKPPWDAVRKHEDLLSILDGVTEGDLEILACLYGWQERAGVALEEPIPSAVIRAGLLFEYNVERDTGVEPRDAVDVIARLCGTGLCRAPGGAQGFAVATTTFRRLCQALGLHLPSSARPPAPADLRGMRLLGRDLSGAGLGECDLSGAHLVAARLAGAYLRAANLRMAQLAGADLSGATLYGANLSGADLQRARLADADLGAADLSGACLQGADLSRAKVLGARLEGAKVDKHTVMMVPHKTWRWETDPDSGSGAARIVPAQPEK